MRDVGRILYERGWRKVYTLNELVNAWQHMVESVEDDYALTIDDYMNDLGVRGWLDQARSLVTRPVHQSFDDRLVALDARFEHATIASRSDRRLMLAQSHETPTPGCEGPDGEG